ncbi:MAG: AtpZ/AtpI family protein [Synechococcus sp.]
MTGPEDSGSGNNRGHKRKVSRNGFRQQIREKSIRKQQARQEREKGVWFWMGTFGLVGWSVSIPTLGGIALGIWIDRRWPSPYSWTLMLLFAGLGIGCWNAWFWIRQESQDE